MKDAVEDVREAAAYPGNGNLRLRFSARNHGPDPASHDRGSDGGEFSAPINQFQKLRKVVPWDFKNVVRISTNSLWETAFIDLGKEPQVVTIPDSGRFRLQLAGSTCGPTPSAQREAVRPT